MTEATEHTCTHSMHEYAVDSRMFISPLNYGPAYVALDFTWPIGNSMVACLK